jgi:hypothetical protein
MLCQCYKSINKHIVGLECLTPLSTIVQLYRQAVSFIGGGNRNIRRKPLTCRKSLANFIWSSETVQKYMCVYICIYLAFCTMFYANICMLTVVFMCRDRQGCDRMIVGFTTTYAISDYHH